LSRDSPGPAAMISHPAVRHHVDRSQNVEGKHGEHSSVPLV
jgi:hypothetical protein